MGNNQTSGRNRLAFTAMAELMKVTKFQLFDLREVCLRYSLRPDPYNVNTFKIKRKNFRKAMEEVEINDERDFDVFDQLFTMWDKTGDDEVNTILFLASVSPLSSVMDTATKLELALKMFDANDTGIISHGDMMELFDGINATASYFGDSVVTPNQIEMMCKDIFKNPQTGLIEKSLLYDRKIHYISFHPTTLQFSDGKGTMRYGTRDKQS